MNNACDLIVIGAGPAGLMAGCETVRGNLSVIIIEKDDRIGYPLNCGEAVTVGSVNGLLTIKPHWIKNRIERGLLVSPSGHTVELHHPEAGYILDRPVMEQDLADEFVAAGGTLMTGCRAVGLGKGTTLFESITFVDSDERERQLFAHVFIAADGVEGTIARRTGIDNRLNLNKTEAFLQYRLHGVSGEPDLMEIYIGSDVAPRSYAWVFPRGVDEVTVGLGVPTTDGDQLRARELLDRFVVRRFGGGDVVATSCGTSPRYQGPDRLALSNLLVVGDAARVLDSVTGAGIANAILSGKIAGQAAVAYVRSDTKSLQNMYDIYPRQFTAQQHHILKRYAEIKDVIDRLSDQELDEVVLALDDYFGTKTVDSISPMAIFLGIVKKRPRLLKLARHLF